MQKYLLQSANPHPAPISGTDDLLTLFHLEETYNTFLRPYLDPSLLNQPAALPAFGAPAADSPADASAVTGKVDLTKGKGKAASPVPVGGGASPAPHASASAGGLKITLGGIKFGAAHGGSPSPSPSVPPEGTAALPKSAKRLKMEKGFDWMVGDVLGLPQIRSRNGPQNFLRDLVLNPDPTPCPPLHQFDAHQLKDAFTLEKGGLAGFGMGIWEGKPPAGTGGGEKKKKKSKRQREQQHQAAGGEAKKQRQ
ncbi:hypothetical protein JCM11641_002311 [Rhodosporidiobolus odoratus]